MSSDESSIDIGNDAVRALDALIGTWRVEISNAQFLDDGAHITGRMTATWMDGHAFVIIRSMSEGGPPAAVQVIGRNEDRDDFTVLYADERGVSRVYAMTFADGEWTQARADPGFHQRFVAHLSKDGRRIDGAWHRSHDDGASWVHDFDIAYVRT